MQIVSVTSIYAYIKTQWVTFEFILAMNFNFSSFLIWLSLFDSSFNLTLLIICKRNANFKTEWVIQNELLPLKLGKSSISMGFTWQGSDHIQEI